jgi:hypothetical protein
METRRHHSSFREGIILVQNLGRITHFLELRSNVTSFFPQDSIPYLEMSVGLSDPTNLTKTGAVQSG